MEEKQLCLINDLRDEGNQLVSENYPDVANQEMEIAIIKISGICIQGGCKYEKETIIDIFYYCFY